MKIHVLKTLARAAAFAMAAAMSAHGQAHHPVGGGAAAVAGDWLAIHDEYIYHDNKRMYISLAPYGDACLVEFQKVDNFWLEGTACFGKWRVDGDRIVSANDRHPIRSMRGKETRMRYSVFGDTLVTADCDELGNCPPTGVRFLKSGIAAFRKNAGAIRRTDPSINYTNWTKILPPRDVLSLTFEANNFLPSVQASKRYLPELPGRGSVFLWYADGDSLFLIGAVKSNCKTYARVDSRTGQSYGTETDCAITAAKTVGLKYSHVPDKSLTLRSAALGIDDEYKCAFCK